MADSVVGDGRSPGRIRQSLAVSVKKASAVYIFAFLVLLFALWVPNTFLTTTTWRSLLGQQSITALVAIGLCIPLAAGVFDLSIGTTLGIGMMLSAWLISEPGVSVPLAVLIAIGAGCLVGLTNAFFVLVLRIDSFIATLGMASVLTSVMLAISQGQLIAGLSSDFKTIGNTQFLGVILPFYVMLSIGLVLWYVLERTPVGRRFYATGGNRDAAALTGVNTGRVMLASMVVCSTVAALAGVLLSASLGAADPSLGPGYLLPAFSAVFLGSTQFRNGRFNIWGTVVAIYVLALGTKGLQLAGAPFWIPSLFNGLSLILAVAVTRSQLRSFAFWRLFRSSKREETQSGSQMP